MKFLPVVTAKRIFFWIRSQTKTKSLNFSTHFRLMDFIKIILWNSPNFHSCGIFQGMACISRNKIQQLWIAVFTYYILISHIFSKILHTKSYTTYQKFSNYLVSFQKIYISVFFFFLQVRYKLAPLIWKRLYKDRARFTGGANAITLLLGGRGDSMWPSSLTLIILTALVACVHTVMLSKYLISAPVPVRITDPTR